MIITRTAFRIPLAGGGGFFLMVSNNLKKSILYLRKKKLNSTKFKFTFGGTQVEGSY